MSYIIGIDPATTKGHGMAVYHNGKLMHLAMLRRSEVIGYALNLDGKVIFGIEDNTANKSTYRASEAPSKPAAAAMGRNIGELMRAQIELQYDLEDAGIDYQLIKQSSGWKSQTEKKMFERITGWDKKSNEDTRSAAYMGFLVLPKTAKLVL